MRLLEPNGWIVLTMSFIVLDKTIDAEEDVVSNIYCVLYCVQHQDKMPPLMLNYFVNKFHRDSLKCSRN